MTFDLTPEQDAFKQSIEQFAREVVLPHAGAIDKSGEFPEAILRAAAGIGLAAVTIPRQWGGAGRDSVSYALAIEAVAGASATVAASLAVTNSLVAELIAHAGSASQRDAWLPQLARGDAFGAFALSEADAGTDAANQQTVAIGSPDGYHLRGRKVWVANAERASVAVVFAATSPERRERGVTAFLVPLDRPGVTRASRTDSLGVRGLGCMDLELDVDVSHAETLGGVDEGFALALWALDGGRIAIAAQALGIGTAALGEALSHAKRRKTFGRPIGDYQAIQWMLADMATELDAARMLTLKAAATKDQQVSYKMEASMAKLAASEAAHRAADRTLQILASAGYRRGALAERLFRDARATEIYQGTSEVQRMIIARAVLASE